MEFITNSQLQKATPGDIVKFEDYLQVSLPSAYKEFLLELSNQGEPRKSLLHYVGIDGRNQEGNIEFFHNLSEDANHNLIRIKYFYENRIPNNALPIAEILGGDQICMRLTGEDKGAIFYWDHEYELEYSRFKVKENLAKISNSFNEFISMLLDDPDHAEEE